MTNKIECCASIVSHLQESQWRSRKNNRESAIIRRRRIFPANSFQLRPFLKGVVANDEQRLNAVASIVSTLAGISMAVKAVQFAKAPEP